MWKKSIVIIFAGGKLPARHRGECRLSQKVDGMDGVDPTRHHGGLAGPTKAASSSGTVYDGFHQPSSFHGDHHVDT